jgi:hypothetical protein
MISNQCSDGIHGRARCPQRAAASPIDALATNDGGLGITRLPQPLFPGDHDHRRIEGGQPIDPPLSDD